MTEREALKKMYQLLLTEPHAPTVCEQLERIAREALAQPEQEPVAVKHMMEWVDYLKRKSDYGQHLQIPSEMSAGACWDLARELEQFINTTPPQRTWVGLTNEEIAHATAPVFMSGNPTLTGIARAIEAAHGIKGEA